MCIACNLDLYCGGDITSVQSLCFSSLLNMSDDMSHDLHVIVMFPTCSLLNII